MDFNLNDKQEALVQAVRAFARKYASAENLQLWQKNQSLPDELVSDFVHLDFQGFGIIHRRQHKYYDTFEQALVLEEVARGFAATLPIHNDLLNLRILGRFANRDQFADLLGDFQESGRIAFAMAVSEPGGGSDTMGMQSKVRRVRGKLRLNGTKTYVNNGEYASSLIVAAIDGEREASAKSTGHKLKHPPLSFWVVPGRAEGITTSPIPKVGQPILPFASIDFKNVELSEEARLRPAQGSQPGFPQLFQLFEIGRLFVCATVLGLAQAAMEAAVAYAAKRQAFGQTIGGFQQIETMLTDMQVRLDTMRSYVYKVAWQFDQGISNRLDSALMKRYVPATGTAIASDAIQIFGGRGYTSLERVSSIWQDCRGFQIAEGTDQIMAKIAAPLLFQKYL